jgi:hypothetical protein
VLRPIFLAAVFAALSLPSFAGDRFERRHHDGYRHHSRDWREFDRYSGDVNIVSIPGVGSWSLGSFGRAGSVRFVETTGLQPEPLMIDVRALPGGNECSMENGVCVIRP